MFFEKWITACLFRKPMEKIIDAICLQFRNTLMKVVDENIIPAFRSHITALLNREAPATPLEASEVPQGTPTKNNTKKPDKDISVMITILASGDSVVKKMKNAENQIRYQYTDKSSGKTDENAVSKHIKELQKTGKTTTKTKCYEIVK
jgi:hypothetical protein